MVKKTTVQVLRVHGFISDIYPNTVLQHV